jgi:hypothetical protein
MSLFAIASCPGSGYTPAAPQGDVVINGSLKISQLAIGN